MPRALPALPALLLLLPLLPLGQAGPAPGATRDVTIAGFAFSPATLAVDLGDTVRWTNQDAVGHTSTSDDGATWDTGTIAGGSSASVAMRVVGTFGYHCAIHPTMTAKLLVGDPARKPDLLVTSITVDDTAPGFVKTVHVTVANQGRNTAPATTAHLAYLYHGALHAIGNASVPQLGPLTDKATVDFTWNTAGKLGDFVLDAEADSGHVVDEADETNNHAQKTTSVLLGGVPGVDLLDPLG